MESIKTSVKSVMSMSNDTSSQACETATMLADITPRIVFFENNIKNDTQVHFNTLEVVGYYKELGLEAHSLRNQHKPKQAKKIDIWFEEMAKQFLKEGDLAAYYRLKANMPETK